MMGWVGTSLVAGLSAIGALACASAKAESARPSACASGAATRGAAVRVLDGRTFALTDGREVRLAAIEVPAMPQAPNSGGASSQGSAARDILAALVLGTEITLRRADPATDRYGRFVAYVTVNRDGSERLAQGELIAAGYARVADRVVGERACAAELLRAERAARLARLGLWADSYYESLNADNPAKVLAERGHFALVEGTVLSVRESGATIYVNFGRRWSEDFTVTILKRNARTFTAAGLEPKRLEGRHVRVRGIVEERGGPWIEAVRPEQIELADRE